VVRWTELCNSKVRSSFPTKEGKGLATSQNRCHSKIAHRFQKRKEAVSKNMQEDMKEKLLQRFQNMQEEMDSSHRTGSTGIECIKTWHQTWIEGYLAFQLGCPPASTNNAWKPGSLLVALTTSIESKQ